MENTSKGNKLVRKYYQHTCLSLCDSRRVDSKLFYSAHDVAKYARRQLPSLSGTTYPTGEVKRITQTITLHNRPPARFRLRATAHKPFRWFRTFELSYTSRFKSPESHKLIALKAGYSMAYDNYVKGDVD